MAKRSRAQLPIRSIRAEIARQGILRGEFAQVARLDPSHLSSVLSGARRPGPVASHRILEACRQLKLDIEQPEGGTR